MLAGLFRKIPQLWTHFGGQWRRRGKNVKAKLAALIARRVKAMREIGDFILSCKPVEKWQVPARLDRALFFETLESRTLLSVVPPFSWSNVLTVITPVFQPSGNMPADVSQEVPLETFTPGIGYPDIPTIPDYHAFVLDYNALVTTVADTSTMRPAAWGEMAAANSYEYRIQLDDNGMLPLGWAINWNDGSPLDRVASGTPWADHAYAGAGTYNITVTAYSAIGTFSFDTTGTTPSAITADIAPVAPGLHVTNDPDTFVDQSFSLSGNAAFSFPNPGAGNYAHFSYDIGWGDGSSDTTGTLTLEGDNSGLPSLIYSFSDSHTYSTQPDDPSQNPYTLAISVTNTDLPDTPVVYSQSFPVYVLDVPPVVSSITPSAAAIDASSEAFTVNFSSPVTNVQASDFTLDGSGISGTIETPTAVDATSGYADQYTVTVDNLSYTGSTNNGTLGLDLLDDDSITDANSTPLGGVGLGNGSFVGQTCVVSTQLTWNGTGENWNSSNAWTISGSSVATTWVAGSDAVIPVGVTSVAIATDDTISANSITFLDNTTLSGGTIDLGTGGTTIDVESSNVTIASLIEDTPTPDTATLDKIGPGTVLLSNYNNSFTSTEIDDGVVQLGATGALGSTSGKLGINGGTLDLAAHDLALLSLYGNYGTIMDSSNTAPTLTVTDGTSSFGGSIVGDVVVEGSTTPAGNQTSISLQSSADPVEYGQSVTLTASVTAAGATTDQLTGDITFYDSGTALGSAVPVDAAGQATLTTTLAAGTRDITAAYSDDAQFVTSTSDDLMLEVGALATITDIPTDAVENSSVTLGSTVAGVPTGSTTTYAWNAIDNQGNTVATGTDSTLTFTPGSSGTYTVELTASSDGIAGPTDTETFSVGDGTSAPAFTDSDTISTTTLYVNAGQNLTLPTQYFTDPALGNVHTAVVTWGDGTSDNAQIGEEYDDDTETLIPGTIDDSHVYTPTTATTFDGTITLSDGSASVTENFTVVVQMGEVTLNSFAPSSDGSQFQVSYTVATATAAPFDIDIYTSPDGTTPNILLTSVTVDGSTGLPLTVGTHTASFTPAFDDFNTNYQLIAAYNSSAATTASTIAFSGGIFVADSVTADPSQEVLYVFGTNSGSGDNVYIHGGSDSPANTVVFDAGTPLSISDSITGIHVRGEAGNDTFEADSDVTLPLWLFGGSGNSTLVGGAGDDLIVGGSGTNVIHGGDGFNSPEIVDNSDTTTAFPSLASNYSESGSGWSSDTSAALANAFNSDQRIATAATGSTATWTFAGLTAGAYYDLYVTWAAESGASTAAQYTVADPGYTTWTSLATIDQTQPPVDDQAAGVFWHHLGVFQSQSGTLTVTLASDTAGHVLAGASRLVLDATATAVPTTNLVMDSFSVDSNGLSAVTYEVTGAASTPFSIGIYESTDGKQATTLVGTIDVSGQDDLAGNNALAVGTHTLEYTGDLAGLAAGQYYIAKLDAYDEVYETSKSDNLSSPLTGVFQTPDGSLYVLAANDDDGHSINVTQDSGAIAVSVDSTTSLFGGVSQLYIAAYQGTNTINAAGIDIPMTIDGGSGSDTITGGDGGNTIYGGTSGGNTITAGAGDDTIYGDGSTSNTITGGSGNLTAYAGNGGDNITGGSGNNEVYGGNGNDTINVAAGQNNWVQAGSGGATITGGSGSDWLYAGNGSGYTYNITGGSGTEKIFGGSGTNILTGGGGVDDITGGSGKNFIYGHGANDLLVGGSGDNYILPDATKGLASVEVKNSDNSLSFDGNINSDGSAYTGDDYAVDPGYGGGAPSWNFDDFNSGSRLGDSSQTPVAIYVTWDPSHTSLVANGVAGTQWAENAVYTVYDGTTILGRVTVNQQSAPPGDWTEYTDRPWKLLGVWNIGANDHISIVLSDGDIETGDRLCVGDAMTQAIWPTESIRPTDVTINSEVPTAFDGDYIDWSDACQPVDCISEGTGVGTPVDLHASIDPLYYQIPGAPADAWQAELPNEEGVVFSDSSDGDGDWSPDQFNNLVDQSLTESGEFDKSGWMFCAEPSPSAAGDAKPSTVKLTVDNKAIDADPGNQIEVSSDFGTRSFESTPIAGIVLDGETKGKAGRADGTPTSINANGTIVEPAAPNKASVTFPTGTLLNSGVVAKEFSITSGARIQINFKPYDNTATSFKWVQIAKTSIQLNLAGKTVTIPKEAWHVDTVSKGRTGLEYKPQDWVDGTLVLKDAPDVGASMGLVTTTTNDGKSETYTAEQRSQDALNNDDLWKTIEKGSPWTVFKQFRTYLFKTDGAKAQLLGYYKWSFTVIVSRDDQGNIKLSQAAVKQEWVAANKLELSPKD
jgi:Ca2+-binding RTX toxin-like protein